MTSQSDISADVMVRMQALGTAAKRAARAVALASTAVKRTALLAAAVELRRREADILAANALDVADAKARGTAGSFIDRLELTPARVEAMARGVEDVADLPDPVGKVLAAFDRPNGLHIERVATPLGVIGVIYESRPNVTADAGALCLMAGNACILRGGSESFRSSGIIHACLVAGLKAADLPEAVISRVESTDRACVGAMLTGLNNCIDVIVPRGGKSLVARVQSEARVPVFAHLEGIVHIYIDAKADLAKALPLVLNAKLRRTGVCGSAETLLVDRAARQNLAPLVNALLEAGCEVRGDTATQAIDLRVKAAVDVDWRAEYLDAIIAVKLVDGVQAAIDHIENYGSHHTDCIVTEDEQTAQKFMAEVDSAIVMHNASTQFADGGEFGFGAEIGIATGRMHARGPVGVEQLTSFKYRVHGSGQLRP